MSEVQEDLREHKHANGKVFYVEDARSEHSRHTADGVDGVDGIDEQSVIAMLDDVLDAEEDAQQLQLEQQIFERNFSIDSELLPSVIETTIVATVHSSSSDDDDGVSQQSLMGLALNRQEECRRMAEQMLDDMFDSEAFYEQLQKAQMNHRKEEELIQLRSQLKRVPSTASQASYASSVVDDPLHSEKFKNRLSHLIMGGQPHEVRPARRQQEVAEPVPEVVVARPTRPQLKQSKSETDVRLLLLKAIRELKADSEDEATGKETVVPSAAAPAAAAATDGNSLNANGDEAPEGRAGRIPRAPKFDPVLYKTINSISLHKQRPGLSRQLVLDAKNVNVAAVGGGHQLLEASSTHLPPATTTSESEPQPQLELGPGPGPEPQPEPLPFKAKLEAILQRGPSHRLQQRPGADVVQRRRPQSTYIEEAAIE